MYKYKPTLRSNRPASITTRGDPEQRRLWSHDDHCLGEIYSQSAEPLVLLLRSSAVRFLVSSPCSVLAMLFAHLWFVAASNPCHIGRWITDHTPCIAPETHTELLRHSPLTPGPFRFCHKERESSSYFGRTRQDDYLDSKSTPVICMFRLLVAHHN
jgi:hypothetical protein